MFEVVEEIANTGAESLEVWFEPWGMQHTLSPGQMFRVVAASEEIGRPEIEREGSRVVVYGWSGCTLRVYCGEELIDDFAIKMPSLPPGISAKSFIGSLFGRPSKDIQRDAPSGTARSQRFSMRP